MTSTPKDASVARRSSKRRWYWSVWIVVVAFACVGLKNYRIDNDIVGWTPGLTASHGGAFVIIGFDRGEPDAGPWRTELGNRAGVAVALSFEGDGEMDGILVAADRGTTGAQLLSIVRDALGADAGRVPLAGPPVFREALDTWSQRGLPGVSGLILLIGALVMGLTTRRWRSVIESLAAVFSAQLVLLGLIALTGTAMDMVLSMTPPLLMSLGFSFAAHRATRSGVNRALLLSMATTAVALALFAFTGFRPVRAFALWGATGVVLTWAAVMLLVSPPVIQAMSLRHTGPVAGLDVCESTGMNRRLAWVAVLLGAFVTLGGVLALPNLKLQDNTLAYFPDDAQVVRDFTRIDDELTGTLPFEVVIEHGDADPTELIRQTPGVRRFEFVTADARAGRTVYFGLASNQATRELARAQGSWQRWATSHGVVLRWTGVAAQVDYIGRSVWRTACWALPTMLGIAAIAGWLVDRRVSSWVLCVWVNTFPVAVLGVLLWVSGKPVGLPSFLISALAIGVALDDTLHILLARKGIGSINGAVHVCRRACLGSSLAAALCMLTFVLCPFRPTAEFGFLVLLTVIAATIGDLILLPAAATVLSMDPVRNNEAG